VLYVFYGEDRFRAGEALAALRGELDRDGNLAINTVRLEGGTSASALRAACQVASFFAESRLVIVEGLLGRLSGARRRGARRNGGKGGAGGGELDEVIDILTNLPDSTAAVLLDAQAPKAFLDAVAGKAEVRQFAILRPAAVRRWAAERVRAQSAQIASRALDRLVALIDGSHLGELAQEIDKLATYAAGRQIEAADVEELVSGAIEHKIWDLTDAVVAGRADRALAVMREMDDRDSPPPLLLFWLVRQYRQLLLVQALLGEGRSRAQVGAELGINHPFVLDKVMAQVGQLSPVALEASYRRLFETDVAVKTGVLEAQVAIELLIVELASLVTVPRRGVRRS
jgi:DNA polymerase-3 subunit delta